MCMKTMDSFLGGMSTSTNINKKNRKEPLKIKAREFFLAGRQP